MDRLTIVGLDPGTTVGYAVLDLTGSIIDMNSAKQLDLSTVIRLLTKMGRPVIIATDKAKIPTFVAKAATKLGARVHKLDSDMVILEKKELVRIKTKNTHQFDALASAKHAYLHYKPLFKKIDRFIKKNKLDQISLDLYKLMILKDNISLKSAVQTILPQKKKATKVKSSPKTPVKDYDKLHARYNQLKLDHKKLIKQRNWLQTRPSTTQIIKEDVSSKVRKAQAFKDRKLDAMGAEIKKLSKKVSEQRKLKNKLLSIIKDDHAYLGIEILANLGRSTIIPKKNIVMVKNCSVISKNTLPKLEKVDIIITPKTSKTLINHIIINPKDLNILEIGKTAIIKKTELDRILDKKSLIKKILKDYKKGREV